MTLISYNLRQSRVRRELPDLVLAYRSNLLGLREAAGSRLRGRVGPQFLEGPEDAWTIERAVMRGIENRRREF